MKVFMFNAKAVFGIMCVLAGQAFAEEGPIYSQYSQWLTYPIEVVGIVSNIQLTKGSKACLSGEDVMTVKGLLDGSIARQKLVRHDEGSIEAALAYKVEALIDAKRIPESKECLVSLSVRLKHDVFTESFYFDTTQDKTKKYPLFATPTVTIFEVSTLFASSSEDMGEMLYREGRLPVSKILLLADVLLPLAKEHARETLGLK